MTSLPIPAAALAPDISRRLRELAERWEQVGAAERANYQLYLIELCEAIGVTRPRRRLRRQRRRAPDRRESKDAATLYSA